ncbi:DUF2993 domain-containing protein [Phormidium sp. CLA17]|uniref:LmeA family phospholipid-binding protein n=1 Tax=Leptolyngbya sp. Cla-17 TaxID=2803751 RepID=UPI0014915AAB|nr:DUF2993 domain-containing protein [Leptolyngbya sp. Cla-17]MBM0743865.1 DUF2993 domain-containing protein [Leptolyngbya sp. Cla-17]
MQIFILILSSLISVLSPVNFGIDKVAESTIRAQFKSVEQLKVRVDNTPVHNAISGKVDKIRIAGRGLFPLEGVRIDTLEFETDPINVNVKALRKEKRTELQAPLGVGMRLVIREEDLLTALQAPVVQQQIQKLLRGLNNSNAKQTKAEPSRTPETGLPQQIQELRTKLDEYRILNPKVEFLPGGRIKLEVEVEEVKTAEKLKVEAESGITFAEGQRLTLIKPALKLNGVELPEQIIQAFATDFLSRFKPEQLGNLPGNLGQVKWSQLTARVIKLQVKDKKLELVAFLRLPQGLKI